MKSPVQWSRSIAVLVVLIALLRAGSAPAVEISGGIDGVEVAIQSGSHGAVFVFGLEALVDGRARKGWGWIEVFHDPLPEAGQSTAIVGGRGVFWIGFRRYRIDVLGGQLTASLLEDGIFDVVALLDVIPRRGGSVFHDFAGQLSHQTFPPTIAGAVGPSVP